MHRSVISQAHQRDSKREKFHTGLIFSFSRQICMGNLGKLTFYFRAVAACEFGLASVCFVLYSRKYTCAKKVCDTSPIF